MQPQTPNPPISSPAPNPTYDFILRDPQKSKRQFGLPGGKFSPIKILVILGGLFFIALIIIVVASKGSTSNTQQMVVITGRAQEIARVSALVQTQSKDPNTVNLAATTQIALNSEQTQLTAYLAKHGVKVSPAQLAIYKNSSTDTQLSDAQQNNALEKTYDAYLKNNLGIYQGILQTAGKGASTNTIAILNDAYFSAQVILAAPAITTLPAGS